MADAPAQIEALRLDDFIRQYEDNPFEIINGERIPLMPPVTIHALIIKRLLLLFGEYEKRTQHGEAFSEAPFVLIDSPNWVSGARVPDLLNRS
ncbi:MAG TPA: hypothetical protein VJZ27_02700, partial [Aggregatilineales bacterium]|nr:hypothetical protein [Aggregatilineales bacterium]